jgi:hypothetical protein
LRPRLVEGPIITQKIDPLDGSTQANQFFHIVKGKYTDKCLNFETSIEAHFPLGITSQSGNPGSRGELTESSDIPSFPAECDKMFSDIKSKLNNKRAKKTSPERRKRTTPEIRRDQELAGTVGEGTIALSQNRSMARKTKSKKNKL